MLLLFLMSLIMYLMHTKTAFIVILWNSITIYFKM